jgi:hypothetical protein
MSAEVVLVSAPGAATSTTAREPASFDERWAAWEAKGAAHDRAARRRVAIAAPILIVPRRNDPLRAARTLRAADVPLEWLRHNANLKTAPRGADRRLLSSRT